MKGKWKLVLLGVLLAISSLLWCSRENHAFEKAAGENRFSVLKWEMNALAKEFRDLITPWDNGGRERTKEEEARFVLSYFALVSKKNELEHILEQRPHDDSLREEIADTKRELRESEGDVENILKRQVRETLIREGITNPWHDASPITLFPYLSKRAGLFFPPLNFEFEDSPKVLVVSYRDRLEAKARITLDPSLTPEEMERIESKIEALGYDALIVETSGIATYPTMVTPRNIRSTISNIAHEWAHHYLAFRPMGARVIWYYTTKRGSDDIVALNETTASIAGVEIGTKVWERYYAPFTDDSPARSASPQPDAGERLREIRKTVEEYLERGAVEEAEAYMEARRTALERDGYFIRKLNQSFFIWYGYYARSPVFQDTREGIGWKLLQVRAESPSFRSFLERVSNVTNLTELDQLLEAGSERNIERNENEIIGIILTGALVLILASFLFFLAASVRKLIRLAKRMTKQ